MEHIVGIDLHSNNGYYAIVDPDEKRVFEKRIPNEMPMVLSSLEPFKKLPQVLLLSQHIIGTGWWTDLWKTDIR